MFVNALGPSLPRLIINGVFKDPFSLACSSESRPDK